MQLPADYHVHTFLCNHAVGDPNEYVVQAKVIGVSEIGFADHAPMPREDFDDWRMSKSQLEEYIRLIEGLRARHTGLEIRLGLEVDYIPGYEWWTERLIKTYEWDYIIGSVHYLGDWDFDNSRKIQRWNEVEVDSVWRQYVELLIKAVQSGFFDVIGHLDLPKKFGHRPKTNVGLLFADFFRVAANAGIAIEINTSGLRKDCREIYPSMELLQEMVKLGTPITFGSDAHAPGEVGWEFPRAVALAREVGFKSWVRFIGRKREHVELRTI